VKPMQFYFRRWSPYITNMSSKSCPETQ
jgi:hypothetical protein